MTREDLIQTQGAWHMLPGDQRALLLKDLANFCRANASCFHPDPRLHAVLEGRREVWLRIREYLDLTPDELVAARGGATLESV